jgi:thymidylate synthase ThyX
VYNSVKINKNLIIQQLKEANKFMKLIKKKLNKKVREYKTNYNNNIQNEKIRK